jgi:hypothetical protein
MMKLPKSVLHLLVAALGSVGYGQETASMPTFTRDVAPILFARCAVCHRTGESAPFPLLEYVDAKKRAKQLLEVVESRRMPPWMPMEGHGEFIGERRLKPEELATLRKWVEQGCKEGNPADLPPAPKFQDGWALGEPDLIVTMPQAYAVPAEGRDIVRAFTLPLGLTEDKFLRAVQFRAGNPRVVHHALMLVDPTKESRQKDEADPEPGFDGSKIGLGAMIGGMVGSWTPGYIPKFYEEGLGREVKKGSDLVLQIHLNPNGKAALEKSQVGFWFTKGPPQKLVTSLALFSTKIDLPPDEKGLEIRDKVVLPVTVDLFAVVPHAHHLARECRIWAKDPDGKEISLLWIKDWDFNWQDQFHYKENIRLRPGTEINLVWTFDNTSGNPRNPSNPPVRVRYGETSRDEMATAGFHFATSSPADKLRLLLAVMMRHREK